MVGKLLAALDSFLANTENLSVAFTITSKKLLFQSRKNPSGMNHALTVTLSVLLVPLAASAQHMSAKDHFFFTQYTYNLIDLCGSELSSDFLDTWTQDNARYGKMSESPTAKFELSDAMMATDTMIRRHGYLDACEKMEAYVSKKYGLEAFER